MAGFLEVVGGGQRTILLTPRERDVLVALCEPLAADVPIPQPASTREIAARLVVTEAAVKQHLLNLYDKFGLDDDGTSRRVRLASEAVRWGAVSPGRADRSVAAHGPTDIAGARAAFGAGDYATGRRSFRDLDARTALETADLESLADCCRWTDGVEESVMYRERAHRLAVETGDRDGAARTALGLVVDHI